MEILERQLEIQVWGLTDVWAGDLESISVKMFFKSRAIDAMIKGEMGQDKERTGPKNFR